jgi:hypothetical protein
MIRELTSGKGQFRLVLQPMMAVVLGIRLGISDARAGHQPFLKRLLAGGESRWALFKESIKRALSPLALALSLDVILQRLTLGYARLLPAIIVAAVLVWIPFALVRGATTRFWRRSRRARRPAHAH